MSAEDIAQEVELKQWELNNRTRPEVKRYAPGDQGYGPEFCTTEDCENPMQDKRREWGFTVCVECQAKAETKAKHFRH